MFEKIKSKKGSVDLITLLIAIVIFAAIATFVMTTILGDKKDNSGIAGASQRVNNDILYNMP